MGTSTFRCQGVEKEASKGLRAANEIGRRLGECGILEDKRTKYFSKEKSDLLYQMQLMT